MVNGRITWSDLACHLGLSSPATAERVHRLQEHGVITGFTARVNPESAGCGLLAFIAINLERPQHQGPFLQVLDKMQEIQECHHVAGDADYLLKVRCRGTRDLERVVSEIKQTAGVTRSRTTIVMNTHKETPAVPLFREQSYNTPPVQDTEES